MAVQILGQPKGNSYVSDPFKFTLAVNDAGSDTEDIRIGYQLLCDDDTPATKEKYFKPKALTEGQTIDRYPIDFSRQVRSRLSTTPPDLAAPLGQIQNNSGFKKGFKLKYWAEVIGIGEENCGQREIIDEKTTETILAINTAYQWYNPYMNPSSNASNPAETLFTSRPKCIEICKDACDFLYICGRDFIKVEGTAADGTVYGIGSVPLVGTAGEATYIKIKPYDESIKGVDYIIDILTDINGNQFPVFLGQNFEEITYTYGDVSITYKFKCCCDQHRNIYFQESTGGYAVMSFCCVESISNTTSSEDICFYTGCANPTEKESRYLNGNTIYKKEAQESLLLSSMVKDCKEQRRWLNEFLNSKSYFIEECDVNGDPVLVRFKVGSGTLATYNGRQTTDLQINIQGIIDVPFDCPNNRFTL